MQIHTQTPGNKPSFWVVVWKKKAGKTVQLSKIWEADTLSPNGSVLDVHYPCFHKGPAVLSFVFILSRGLYFQGGGDMNFSTVSDTWRSTEDDTVSDTKHWAFLGGPVIKQWASRCNSKWGGGTLRAINTYTEDKMFSVLMVRHQFTAFII